ncbi:hypothetical protein GCM10027162_34140 [Streptomyces incanus]
MPACSGPVSDGRRCWLILPILHHPTDNATGDMTPTGVYVRLAGESHFGQTVRPLTSTLLPACGGAACHHRAGGDW